MTSKLPYHKQQTPFSCSLACLRMVLEAAGIVMEEYQLAPLVNYDPDIGVPMPFMVKACRAFNLKYKLIKLATLDDLKHFISKGLYPIVVLQASIYPKVLGKHGRKHGHMVVVKDIAGEGVIINDPDKEYGGEDKKVKLEVFLEAWTASKNWLLAIGVDSG